MKKLFLILFLLSAGLTSMAQMNSSQFSVNKIEGGSVNLSAFQGNKILVITLPVTINSVNDSILLAMDTLAQARVSGLRIVAVPSLEDGFSQSNKTQLLQWYRTRLGNNIIITEGLYTRKSSGSQQHDLFKWLTDVRKNLIFDIDPDEPGFKYFINTSGNLYGVLRPHSKIGGQSVQKTLAIN